MNKHYLKSLIEQMFNVSITRKLPYSLSLNRIDPFDENTQESNDNFYGNNQAVHNYYKKARLSFYENIIKLLKSNNIQINERSCLDVGCGAAYLISSLLKNYKPSSISGADFSFKAVELSRQLFPNIEFFQHDIYLPFNEKYDIIFCLEVVEHLEFPHLAIANLKSSLNKGGVIVVSVPDGRVDHLNEHINFWSPESWKVFLERECPESIVLTDKIVIEKESINHTAIGPFNFGILKF